MLILALACAPPDPAHGDGGAAPTWVGCEAPADRVTYTDVGPSWGLVDTTDPELTAPDAGNSVALADLDDDGWDDVVVARRNDGLWVQANRGGRLDAERVLSEPRVDAFTVGDVDGDGDLDLLVGALQLTLLRNDGDFVFTDVTDAWGLRTTPMMGQKRQPSFSDWDLDGDLDLLVLQAGPVGYAEREMLSFLWRNDGDRFVDARALVGDEGLGSTYWNGLWTDQDRDGDPDLLLPADLPHVDGPSWFYRNDAGTFADDSAEVGVSWFLPNMGGSAGDYDGDGAFDVFLTATGPNALYRNVGGAYVDVTLVTGTSAYPDQTTMSLGSAFVDHDNDGWLDLAIVGGRQGVNEDVLGWQAEIQPDLLLRNQGGTFTDVTAEVGIDDPGDGRGVAVGDIDADGFADLLVGVLGGPSHLWKSTCTDARSVRVRLVGTASNTWGVGAVVELRVDGRVLVTEVTANTGFGAASTPVARFGIGDGTVEGMTVYWPSGLVQDVDADAIAGWVRVVEGEEVGR